MVSHAGRLNGVSLLDEKGLGASCGPFAEFQNRRDPGCAPAFQPWIRLRRRGHGQNDAKDRASLGLIFDFRVATVGLGDGFDEREA